MLKKLIKSIPRLEDPYPLVPEVAIIPLRTEDKEETTTEESAEETAEKEMTIGESAEETAEKDTDMPNHNDSEETPLVMLSAASVW